jgi:type II secretory pathway predicted ATPase ExeA
MASGCSIRKTAKKYKQTSVYSIPLSRYNRLNSSPSSIENLSHLFLSLENSTDNRRCSPKFSSIDEEEILRYYGMTENPFTDRPGTRSSLHNAPGHFAAYLKFKLCIDEQLPAGVLTAPNGMGRDLVLQQMIQGLPSQEFSTVKTTVEAGIHERAFVKNLLYEIGVVDIHRTNPAIHHLAVLLKAAMLEKCAKEGVRLIFSIEEAQHLTLKIFSLLQWLLNIEIADKKLATVLLVGDPGLSCLLQQKEMAFFRRRIYVSATLNPLRLEETEKYLHDKLSLANCRKKIFTPGAVQLIFSETSGICREINSLAHDALIRAYELNEENIDQTIILSCLEGTT